MEASTRIWHRALRRLHLAALHQLQPEASAAWNTPTRHGAVLLGSLHSLDRDGVSTALHLPTSRLQDSKVNPNLFAPLNHACNIIGNNGSVIIDYNTATAAEIIRKYAGGHHQPRLFLQHGQGLLHPDVRLAGDELPAGAGLFLISLPVETDPVDLWAERATNRPAFESSLPASHQKWAAEQLRRARHQAEQRMTPQAAMRSWDTFEFRGTFEEFIAAETMSAGNRT